MNDFPGSNEDIEQVAYEQLSFYPAEELQFHDPNRMVIGVELPRTEHAINIMVHVLPQVLDLFIKKSNRYGEPSDDDLGAAGQYADMHRKWKVIRNVLWEGQELEGGEPVEEVLADMIGHCLKTLEFLREQK